MKRFRQQFPIEAIVCLYLGFYLLFYHFSVHNTHRHHGVHQSVDAERNFNAIAITSAHTTRTHLISYYFFFSLRFFRTIRKSDSFILVRRDRIHFTLLQSRNKSYVCGVDACDMRARVSERASYCFSFFITFERLIMLRFSFFRNTEHTQPNTNVKRIFCRKIPIALAPVFILLHSPILVLAYNSVAVTCKRRVKQQEKKSKIKRTQLVFESLMARMVVVDVVVAVAAIVVVVVSVVFVVVVDLFSADEIEELFTIGPNKKKMCRSQTQ